jgi:hypothetical protein
MTRNEKLLNSFIDYCKANPDQRFWQALRNWAKVQYILTADFQPGGYDFINLKDTFYWENKMGKTHCTQEQFQTVLDDDTKQFALVIEDKNIDNEFFIGTIEQFADCFFSNVCYENIIEFADSNGCIVQII